MLQCGLAALSNAANTILQRLVPLLSCNGKIIDGGFEWFHGAPGAVGCLEGRHQVSQPMVYKMVYDTEMAWDEVDDVTPADLKVVV